MKNIQILLNVIIIFIFSGCSQKNYFLESAKKYNLDYKTLSAIASVESKHNSNVVHVNESIFDIQRGAHYFDNWFTANLYMDTILDPLGLNYDVGICQINKVNFERFDLDNEDLLDDETNIDIAAKIYSWNLRQCKGNTRCALSMYNTGKKHSAKGQRYADKVLKARYRLYGE